MRELLPSFDQLKHRSDEVDAIGREVLGIQALTSLTRASCDLHKLVAYMLANSKRLGHNIDPDNLTCN